MMRIHLQDARDGILATLGILFSIGVLLVSIGTTLVLVTLLTGGSPGDAWSSYWSAFGL